MTILSLISEQAPIEGQKYVQLETLFQQAISEGTLEPGEKLPPLRIAAWNAKCSLGTMSRVYTSLERKGLVVAEVGRGTFVQEKSKIGADIILPSPRTIEATSKSNDVGYIDLGMNAIANDWGENLIRWALKRAAEKASSLTLMTYRDGFGDPSQKLAMRQFLPASLQDISNERIVITHGAQNGIFTALSRLTSPGDNVCIEPLSYPGISAALSQAGLSSITVKTDDQGICPKSFEKLCIEGRIRILVTTATGHNPTCITTPLSRRNEIGILAERHNVLIIEDDIYGYLYPEAPAPYASLFPNNAIYLTGLAKRITPSLRIGVAVAPPHITMLLAQGITAQTWMVSPILVTAAVEIAGRRDDLTNMPQTVKAQADQRSELTKTMLRGKVKSLDICRSHAWIELPETISAENFVKRAEICGVHVMAGHRFANNSHSGHQNIRLSIMAPKQTSTLETALHKLKAILSTPNEDVYEMF
ncbi:PLP-dependent aminotransferase family protein [Kiloniella sp.]|uniref:aminotransferase-like domain-containing protein n=1 Tax=Kiloniella sp. TaxID=1938587 RepID=UPI003B01CA88